jgi:RHS repeat-associated protein
VYTYDADRDWLKEKATQVGTLSYDYYPNGQRWKMQSEKSDGVNLEYTWDDDNRLQHIIDHSDGGCIIIYGYDGYHLAGFVYPNGVSTAYRYDGLNRLTDISACTGATTLSDCKPMEQTLDSGVTRVAAYHYTVHASGERHTVDELSGRNVTWEYDDLHRMISESISGAAGAILVGTLSYEYEAVGNRKTRASNLASIDGQSFSYEPNDTLATDSYDANGNTIHSGAAGYRYDFEDRLVSKAGTLTFAYDGDGNRVSKTVSGVTTTYLIDDAGPTGYAQSVEERVEGAVQKSYVYGLAPISERQLSGSMWGTSYYSQDSSLNVRMLTNSSGAVTDTLDYDAFGTVVGQTGATSNYILFAGEYVDGDLGFVYLRARWMNNDLGRFLSPDTWSRDGANEFHPYAYADLNPINGTDPTGHFTLLEATTAISVIGVTAATLWPSVVGATESSNMRMAMLKSHYDKAYTDWFNARTEDFKWPQVNNWKNGLPRVCRAWKGFWGAPQSNCGEANANNCERFSEAVTTYLNDHIKEPDAKAYSVWLDQNPVAGKDPLNVAFGIHNAIADIAHNDVQVYWSTAVGKNEIARLATYDPFRDSRWYGSVNLNR